MISINTDKKLNIILPNTNKALKKVLKDATNDELEVITKGKDLKSIIGSLLKESSQNSSADKTLLTLVKNNPTLKDLGSASQNIKELLSTLKSDKELLHVEKILQKFLPDMKDIKNADVKTTMQNSGVFLESKLKDIKEPQIVLKNLLTQLNSILKKSPSPVARTIQNQVQELLKSIPDTPTTKENPKLQENLAKSTQEIVKNLTKELKNADVISSKGFTQKLDKLEHLTQTKNLEKTNFKLENLRESIKDVINTLKSSYTKDSTASVNALNKVLQELKPELAKDLPKAISEVVKNIQDIKQENTKQPILPKEHLEKLDKIQNSIENTLVEKKELQLPPLQESIKQMVTSLQTSEPTKETKSIIDLLTKILKPLQNPEQIIDKKSTFELKNIVQDIKTNIAKADPIHSVDVKNTLKELTILNSPAKLSVEQNIKEILNNDLKAVLHKVSQEVTKLQTPTQTEVLKHIDKLNLQIDYYQLVSHLSNSSSLYIPFSWEQMQDGEVSIKHSKDDKFYCDIELKLKDYGDLNVRLTLYDKNQLNINIHAQSDEFKEIMKEAIPELRSALIDMQITPREIRIHEKNQKSTSTSVYNEIAQDLEMGFEVRG